MCGDLVDRIMERTDTVGPTRLNVVIKSKWKGRGSNPRRSARHTPGSNALTN